MLAAFLYACGALTLKRSTGGSAGIWRTTFITNIATVLCLLPLWGFGGTIPSLGSLWQPAVVAVLFFFGQLTAVLALTRGDVTVATPMLGVKILLVAFFTWLILNQPLPARVWIAAGLATCAVAMLGISRDKHAMKRAGFTAGATFIAAACYACFDVLVQQWSPDWGVGRFPPLVGIFAAIFSLLMIPLFRGPLRDLTKEDWTYLGPGALFIGLQGLTFISTIATWGHAAVANVVYSSRGLWSIVLVMLLGHWLARDEHALGGRVLTLRLVGAALLSAAILLLAV